MRILFAGTPRVAADTLEALLASPHEVVGVLTRPDAPRGRSSKLVPSEVAQLAQDSGLEVLKLSAKDPALLARVRELEPEACPVVAYGGLLPQELLDVPRQGWINVHYSLLPRWRGAAPVQRAVEAGDALTGVSIFRIVKELDAGPVFTQVEEPVDGRTSGELLEALTGIGAAALLEVLDALEAGTAKAVEQPTEGVTLAPKLTVAEAKLDWSRPAIELERQIRACNPAPSAWTMLSQTRVKILAASVVAEPILQPGFGLAMKHDFFVGTGEGTLALREVAPQGKKAMRAADWGRGLHGELRFG
ncbi:MAG: methionyl-tRNA formyltransferase [Propionibacteriaceae bacterium]|jgi:methionyl-tRNA formyltransferase|nr:methionyl-tRNA formyltransferase [Propionibacteriaceae bacterium]